MQTDFTDVMAWESDTEIERWSAYKLEGIYRGRDGRRGFW